MGGYETGVVKSAVMYDNGENSTLAAKTVAAADVAIIFAATKSGEGQDVSAAVRAVCPLCGLNLTTFDTNKARDFVALRRMEWGQPHVQLR